MSKNKGYISVWRDIQDNDIWTSEPFSKGQAWIDLLLIANHKEKTYIMGNKAIKTEIGAVVTSEMTLAEKWHWNRKRVRRFLSLLEELEMIEKKSNSKGTTLLIKNYKKYQQKGTAEGTAEGTTESFTNKEFESDEGTAEGTARGTARGTAEGTARGTHTIIINKENKYNNIKKDKQKEAVSHKYGEYNNVLLTDEELEKLREEAPEYYQEKLEALSSYMKSTGKRYKSHYATIRTWIRRDQKKEGEKVERKNSSEDKGKEFNLEDFI